MDMGEKQRSRKGPRRPPAKRQLDPDLRDLAEVLDEYRLATNAEGWLVLPWRDGWNAVGLALSVAGMFEVRNAPMIQIEQTLHEIHAKRMASRDVYVHLDEWLLTMPWTVATPALRCAIRCVQLIISNSSGGGNGFNAVLSLISGSITEEQITLWRCADALGITAGTPETPDATRRVRAFKFAWRRGLYHAAYAIPPAQVT